jgi:hypothetical protein
MDKSTQAILKKWVVLYKRELKNMLKTDGNYASGSTQRSIKGFIYSKGIYLEANKSLRAISEGKKVARKETPTFDMVRRIDKWIMKKNPRLRTPLGKFAKRKGSTYRKRMGIAWAVARKINRTSWKGSKVIDRAYAKTEQQLGDELTQDIKNKIMATLDKFKGTK